MFSIYFYLLQENMYILYDIKVTNFLVLNILLGDTISFFISIILEWNYRVYNGLYVVTLRLYMILLVDDFDCFSYLQK